jgi:DNA-binding transcriptional LysR family regulator
VDARQLEYFLAVVDHDGFRRAAQKLHLAQPSLSQAIAALERELGVLLFHRTGRRVVLTPAGVEMIGPARQVMRDLQTARATMDAVKGVARGRVELVTMPSPGIEPFGSLTRMFTRRHPGVTVSAAAAFTADEVVEKVRSGKHEVGLIGTADPVQAPGVDVLPLEDQPFVLVGGPGADVPDSDPAPRAALSGARLIVSPEGSLMRRIVDEILASGVDAQIVAEVAHRASILPLVLQDVGLAVLPAAWAPLARRAGSWVVGLDPPVHLRVALLSRSAPMTPAATAFLATARSYADQA